MDKAGLLIFPFCVTNQDLLSLIDNIFHKRDRLLFVESVAN